MIQRKMCEILVKHLYPFDWPRFFLRRLCLTYRIDPKVITGFNDAHVFDSVIIKLRRTRPVLVVCWLRWMLNSLPTSSRLHDNGFSACPCCGDVCDDIRHLISCDTVFKIAVSCIRRRGGMPFARPSSDNVFLGAINDTPRPFSFPMHVCLRLGLCDHLYVNFLHRLQLLYIVQYIFTAARRSASSVPLSQSHLQSLGFAAVATLS